MINIGFLGGIAEFGNNCSFIEYKDEIIIIDLGFKFFTQNEMGIRYEIPDFSYLIKNKKKIKGIIITHGHLDHVGGIPFFFKQIHCNVYCSPFTHHIIKKQLKNKNHLKNIKIIGRDTFKLGSFSIEPFPVTHSILDSLGFIIHTPLRDNTKLIFCGDINHDDKPFIGKPNDFSFINDKYKKFPKILFLDSTNATEKGYNLSESDVFQQINSIFKEYPNKKRIIFTTFSSQIQRILEIVEASINHGYKIIALGKSVCDNLEYILEKKEYKKYQGHVSFTENDINKNKKTTILATGSQGEENSTISKMLDKKINNFKINSDDLFIFSSSIIPGNEKRIFEIWNQIYFYEAEVISSKDRNIHSSGHGKVDELKKIIKKIKPDHLIPIHGEYRNLYNQKKVALESHIKPENVMMVHKGDIIKITDDNKNNKIQFKYNLNLNNIILDHADNPIDEKIIDFRKKMIQNGLLVLKLPQHISSIQEISVKGLGINNFYSNEEFKLREIIFDKCRGREKNKADQVIKDFFRQNNSSVPLVVHI